VILDGNHEKRCVYFLNNEAMNIILGFFSEQNFTEIGYFSRAFKTGALLLVFSGAIKPIFFSKLAGLPKNKKVLQLERIQRVWLTLTIIPFFFILYYSEPIIVTLFSNAFLPSVPIFQISIFGSFFYSFLMFHIGFYAGNGLPKYTVIIMGINLLLIIIGGAAIVPVFGALGLAYVYTFSILITLCCSQYTCHTRFGVSPKNIFFMSKNDVEYLLSNIRK